MLSGCSASAGVGRTLWDTYVYVALFLPMAWYYFVGGVRALFNVYGEFNRTPTGKDEHHGALPRIHAVLWLGEVCTLLYSVLALWFAWREAKFYDPYQSDCLHGLWPDAGSVLARG